MRFFLIIQTQNKEISNKESFTILHNKTNCLRNGELMSKCLIIYFKNLEQP